MLQRWEMFSETFLSVGVHVRVSLGTCICPWTPALFSLFQHNLSWIIKFRPLRLIPCSPEKFLSIIYLCMKLPYERMPWSARSAFQWYLDFCVSFNKGCESSHEMDLLSVRGIKIVSKPGLGWVRQLKWHGGKPFSDKQLSLVTFSLDQLLG